MPAVSCCAIWMLGSVLAAHPPESEVSRARFQLRDATLEARAAMPAPTRYRLEYELSPVPRPASKAAGTFDLTGRLDKAGPPQCPVPGTLFFDGFESP